MRCGLKPNISPGGGGGNKRCLYAHREGGWCKNQKKGQRHEKKLEKMAGLEKKKGPRENKGKKSAKIRGKVTALGEK